MNEEAFNDLYKEFVSTGYNGSPDDFKILLETNPEAFQDGFSSFTSTGYKGTKQDFAELIGISFSTEDLPVKKKDVGEESADTSTPFLERIKEKIQDTTVSTLADGSSESVENEGLTPEQIRERQLSGFTFEEDSERVSDPTQVESMSTAIETPSTPKTPRKLMGAVEESQTQKFDEIATEAARAELAGDLYNAELGFKKALEYKDDVKTEERLNNIQQKIKQEAATKEIQDKEKKEAEGLQKELDEFREFLPPQFTSRVNSITKYVIQQNEEDAQAYLNKDFGEFGFNFKQIGWGDALEVIAADGEKMEIDFDTWFDSSAEEEVTKLQSFLNKHAEPSNKFNKGLEDDDITNSIRIRDMRTGARDNGDGTESTVLMTYAEVDGKYVAYPTLFPKNPNLRYYGSGSEEWLELDMDAALDEADKRNELTWFENEEDAANFAEGSWKNVNTFDYEANRFFEKRGLDYRSYRDALDRYDELKETQMFLETRGYTDKENLTKEEKEKYADFYAGEKLRTDIEEVKKNIDRDANSLMEFVNDDQFRTVREDFDVYVEGKFNRVSKDAIVTNQVALNQQQTLNQESIDKFGLEIESLKKYEPKNKEEFEEINNLLTNYDVARTESQYAATQYELANTWFDGKFDKNVRSAFDENWKAVYSSWRNGFDNGQAAQEILYISLGITDIDDNASVEEAAKTIVENLEAAQSRAPGRAEYRWNSARDFREGWDAFKDDPFELTATFVAGSLSQMLPYGTKIIGTTTATGAATGAGVGTFIVPGYGTSAGAVLGAGQGFKTGFAATGYAMEYTNSILDVAREKGYNMMDPNDVVKALKDEEVWKEGSKKGHERGVPIAVMNYVTAGLAGRVFKVGGLSSKTARVSAMLGERAVVDPLGEATGEFLAQVNAGEQVSGKEIFAEAMGGFGNNTGAMAINLYKDARNTNNVDLANKLATIDGMMSENVSEERILSWADNMERLGKINTEQTQRIRENLGLKRDAKNVLDINKDTKSNKKTQSRVMELMAAKKELTSTANRKSAFSQKVTEINKEISEIAETGNLKESGTETNLNIIGLDQTTNTDVRSDVGKYTINNISYTKEEFMKRIEKMSKRKILKTRARVDNDEEVSEFLKTKVDAIQEQETGAVPADKQAGVVEEVEGEVREVPSETEQSETIETEQVEEKQPTFEDLSDTDQQEYLKKAENNLRKKQRVTLGQRLRRFGVKTFRGSKVKYAKKTEVTEEQIKEEAVKMFGLDNQPQVEETTTTQEVMPEETVENINVVEEALDDGSLKSPVYNKNGKRLLFTGSPRKFQSFDMSKVGSSADAGQAQGIFFSNDPYIAEYYSKETMDPLGNLLTSVGLGKLKGIQPTIYSATLNTDNVLEVDFEGQATSEGKNKNKIIQDAFENGYDAVVFKNIYDGPQVKQDVTVVRDAKFISDFTDTNSKAKEITKQLKNKKPTTQETVATEEVSPTTLKAETEELGRIVDEEFGTQQEEVSPTTPTETVVEEEVTTEEGPIDEGDVMLTQEQIDEQVTEEASPVAEETQSKREEIEAEIADIENNELDDLEMNLENIQEEIQNEKDNYKEEAQRIKEEKAKVRKNKTLSKQKKQDKLDDLEAERDGFMNDRDAAIENYQFDLSEAKREARKAKSRIAKLKKKLDSGVDFRTDEREATKETTTEEEVITEKINELAEKSPNADFSLAEKTKTTEEKTDINSLDERASRPMPRIKNLEVINGIPVVFNISDQLTIGSVVNPNTGTTIDNLQGGVGFTGIEGNENLAWASIDEKKAGEFLNKARRAYENNKELFHRFWEANPKLAGLVPMPVVKMSEGSMLSNEAVFRVFLDNISQIPEKNKQEAFAAFKEDIKRRQPKYSTDAERKGVKNIIGMLSNNNITNFKELLTPDNLRQMTLPARTALIKMMTVGGPNMPGQKKRVSAPNSKSPITAQLLAEGIANSEQLLNLAVITDLITEPSTKNVPQKSIISLQGVEVAKKDGKSWAEAGGVVSIEHPNYKGGIKGKTIGVLENPQNILDTYGETFSAVIGKAVKAEEKALAAQKEGEVGESISEDKAIENALNVGKGIPQKGMVGAITSVESVSDANKLANFMNLAFPNTAISTDQATFEAVMNSDRVQAVMKDGDVVYGVTVDGDVYVNPEVHNNKSDLFNTQIHEMGHVWQNYLQTTTKGKEIYAKGVSLVEQTEEFQKQLKKFDGDRVAAAKEAMAILIGNKGETIANASLNAQFKEWLLGMWSYIKDQFPTLSKDLTAKEIQNLTLDKFLGTALADVFSGKDLKITEVQQKKMKNPEVLFSRTSPIFDVIDRGRRLGFTDAAIREVLKDRGFSTGNINEALTVDIVNETRPMPRAFEKVEGGIDEARQLFDETQETVRQFAVMGPRGGVSGVRARNKTFSQIRQKAQETLKANPIFKKQPEQTQQEILLGYDQSLYRDFDAQGPIRSNRRVQAEMAKIRETLKQRKIGKKNLKEAQIRLKNYIRQSLPDTPYTRGAIQRINKLLVDSTVENFESKIEKVEIEIQNARARMKAETVTGILDILKKKSKVKITRSGKRRGAGVNAATQLYFKAVLPIVEDIVDLARARAGMQALQSKIDQRLFDIENKIDKVNENTRLSAEEKATKIQELEGKKRSTKAEAKSISNTQTRIEEAEEKIQKLRDRLNDPEVKQQINEALLIQEENPLTADKILTTKQQKLLAEVQALDNFAPIQGMTLEETNDLLNTLKDMSSESIAQLKAENTVRRQLRADKAKKVRSQIQETNPELFDENGKPLNNNELNSKKDEVRALIRERKIPEAIFEWVKSSFKFDTIKDWIQSAKNSISNVETLANIADRITEGKSIFTDNTYKSLNRMDENNNRGTIATRKKLDQIAESVGIVGGIKGVKRRLYTGIHRIKTVVNKDGKQTVSEQKLNADQLMRIYALSLNDVQRAKLENQGIGKEQLQEIKEILEPDVVKFVEGVVSFLSNEYYEQVNGVYAQVNNVNLGFIENYFPTKTISSKETGGILENGDFSGIFNAETADSFKQRENYKSDIDLVGADFFSTLDNHTQTMEKFMAYAEGVREMNDFFSIPEVGLLLQESKILRAMKIAINQAINPASLEGGNKNKLLTKLQTQFTSFALSFKTIQILKQASSFVQAFEDYNYRGKGKRYIPGMDTLGFMFDAATTILSLPLDLVGKNGPIHQAMEMSATFKRRVEQGIEGDVYGLESGSKTFKNVNKESSRFKRARALIRTSAAAPTVLGDILGVMGYMINHKRNIKNGMSKTEAVEAFNNYNATQQSRRAADKIPLQFDNNALIRSFTMFGSTLFLQMNRVMQSTKNMRRDSAMSLRLSAEASMLAAQGKMKEANQKRKEAAKAAPKRKDVRAFALNLGIANVMFAGTANLAKFIKGDDDDRDEALKKMKEAMMGLNLLYQIPLLGSFAEREFGGNKFAGDVTNPILSIYYKVNKEIEKYGWAGSLKPIVEVVLGMQTDPFIGLYNMFGTDGAEFDQATFDALGISKSYSPSGETEAEKKAKESKGKRTKTEQKQYERDLKEYNPNAYKKQFGERDKREKEIKKQSEKRTKDRDKLKKKRESEMKRRKFRRIR